MEKSLKYYFETANSFNDIESIITAGQMVILLKNLFFYQLKLFLFINQVKFKKYLERLLENNRIFISN